MSTSAAERPPLATGAPAYGHHVTTATAGNVLARAAARLRRTVPYDTAGWFAVDPETVLPTGFVHVEDAEPDACLGYWERENTVEDVLLFRDLARATVPAARLLDATCGSPGRSTRYREYLAPLGYVDELRAAFRLDGRTWAVATLMRRGSRPFSPREVDRAVAAGPSLAKALAELATKTPTAVAAPARGPGLDGPGTCLFAADDRLQALDDQAEHLLTELNGPDWVRSSMLRTVAGALVARARAVAVGRDRGPASVRLRAPSGRWFVLHASVLRADDPGDRSAVVVVRPAAPAEIAPVLVEAYRLTPRERQVTGAVARGLSNADVAAELHLSPHTVRDHLKAVFEKLGVASRGELVATLFGAHPVPDPLGAIDQEPLSGR